MAGGDETWTTRVVIVRRRKDADFGMVVLGCWRKDEKWAGVIGTAERI